MTSVNKIHMSWKRWIKEKHLFRRTLKVAIFVLLLSLPFISITNTIGMNTFLDSFENPENYVCIKDSDNILKATSSDNSFLIIQKISHPDFDIEENDEIIYFTRTGDIICSKINEVTGIGAFTTYYVENEKQNVYTQPILESQIVGKVIKKLDDNPWNILSVTLWETSITKLNINEI